MTCFRSPRRNSLWRTRTDRLQRPPDRSAGRIVGIAVGPSHTTIRSDRREAAR